MKKQLLALVISLGLLLGSVAVSYAISGGDTYFIQRDPTNSFQQITFMPLPLAPSFITMDSATSLPVYTAFGSGMSFSNVSNSLSVAAVPQSSVTSLVSDLAGKMAIPTGTTSQVMLGDGTLGTIGSPKAYEGTTLRSSAFPIFKSATVSSGTAVVNITNDGLSTGTSLCPNGVIADSVGLTVSDSAASYQMAYAFSNSNKTITVTTNKLTTANILTGVLGQTTGNGSVVKVTAWCY